MATAARALPSPVRRTRSPITGGRAAVREVYFTKRIDNSRVVREVDISKLRACFMLAVPLAATFVLLFTYAWLHFQCIRYGYEIGEQQQNQLTWSEQNRELRAQEEAALQQVAPTAQVELGMNPVNPGQVIRVSSSLDGLPLSDEPVLAEARPQPKPPLPHARR